MAALRLDRALVARALVETRTKAQRRIHAGDVSVNDVVATSVSQPVGDADELSLSGGEDYVGRGAYKLLAALEQWPQNLNGALVMDLGASTGGFTQVALDAGATRVVAVDVGHDQLHVSLAEDPRVESFEGINARTMTRQWWLEHGRDTPRLVVADLSFVSLTQVLGPVHESVGATDWIVLVKPQFEVGRTKVSKGFVLDPGEHEVAINAVIAAAQDLGLHPRGVMPSPISGEGGNQEFLCWLGPTPQENPTQWSKQVHLLTHP